MPDVQNDADQNVLGGQSGPFPHDANVERVHLSSMDCYYENVLLKTEISALLKKHNNEVDFINKRFTCQIQENENKLCKSLEELEYEKNQRKIEKRKFTQTNLELQNKCQQLESELGDECLAKKKLEEENAELQELFKHTKVSSDMELQRLQVEKCELTDKIKNLTDDLEKEKGNYREMAYTLQNKKHHYALLKARLDEIEDEYQSQCVSLQNEMEKLSFEKLEERKVHTSKVNELNKQLEEERQNVIVLEERISSLKWTFEEKSGEILKSKLQHMHKLQQENNRLQATVKSLRSEPRKEAQQESFAEELQAEIDQLSHKLLEGEKEKAVLLAKLTKLPTLEEEVKMEKDSCSRLRQKVSQLEGEMQRQVKSCSTLRGEIHILHQRLKEAEKSKSEASQSLSKQLEKVEEVHAEEKSSHQEELMQLTARINSLNAQLASRNQMYAADTSSLKQKSKTYAALIKKLRHKLELSALNQEQLEAKYSALKDYIPPEAYRDLQQQLSELLRKHSQFSLYLKGLSEFETIPEVLELSKKITEIGSKLDELEESQHLCYSQLDSL